MGQWKSSMFQCITDKSPGILFLSETWLTEVDPSACLLTVCYIVKQHTNRKNCLPCPYLLPSHLKCLFCMYAGYFKGFRARHMPQQPTHLQESMSTVHLPQPPHPSDKEMKFTNLRMNSYMTEGQSRNRHGRSVLFLLPI